MFNMLTIATWNVNGIRALKGPLRQHLDALHSDIICFQETKVTSACFAGSLQKVQGRTGSQGQSRRRGSSR